MKAIEKEKNTLSSIKKEVLQMKYLKEKEEEEIIKLLNEYIKKLKLIDEIYLEADIEAYKYGSTSYPDTLYNDLLLNTNNIYALLLGYIDSQIDKTKDESLLTKYNNFRELITNDYINNVTNSTNKITRETLLTKPCYKNFDKVFIEIKENKYSNKNILDIIETYIKGYKINKIYNIENIYNIYINLTTELNVYRKENREKYEKIKMLIIK